MTCSPIDAGCILDGWHSDSAVSVHVGEPPVTMEEVDLITACERAMWAGIAAARAGGRLGDVSWAIENSVHRPAREDGRRYGSVAGYGGHGIGTAMHMAPFVANQGKRGKGPRLVAGTALAIEPMITLGRPATRELADGWTVVTKDGARAAHWRTLDRHHRRRHLRADRRRRAAPPGSPRSGSPRFRWTSGAHSCLRPPRRSSGPG